MISDNFILKKTAEEFKKVFAPKITGTVNLDKATEDIKLDFFVLFSSCAGAIGNIGQADYATANAFMDRFADYRNQLVSLKDRKGKTISINWPLWREGGMVVDAVSEEQMKQSTGMIAMQTETGIQAFYKSLNSNHSQILVMEGLVSKMRKTLFSQTTLQKESTYPQSATVSKINTVSLLAKIQIMLIQEVSKTIKLDLQKIQLDVELDKYGFDSIILMDFAKLLNKKYKLELMPTIFFEYSTIRTFAEYLAREHESIFVKHFNGEFSARTSDEARKSKEDVVSSIIKRRAGFARIRPVINSVSEIKPIAVIGMSGLFAESHNVEHFWQNIESRKNLIKEVPFDHWDYGPWYDSNPEAKDKTYCKWGSFIDGVDQFDASFFNISPREAEWMDPQLRLLLESVYKCSEDAGLITQIRGSDTGVFVGVCFHDYADKISELNLPIDPYVGTGNSQTVIANRVSFHFGLTGPSVSVDTACSSSLFALHQACQAIRNQECKMAFVGGVNLLLSSWHYRYFSSIGALSPTGRCHTFDAKADGYIPGEAIASILLKPLDQAIKDGDTIYAVVKGSAALHGGSTPSLTAPSVSGEKNVITTAWKDADIDPSTLSYIEAHGTGTKLGDPVEIAALTKAFQEFTPEKGFCAIGSAKANIGHSEGAAGITGIIKVIMQMRKQIIPAMPFFKELNPYIQLNRSALFINEKNIPWQASFPNPKRAGISGFGFSGAYAHVVLEEYHPKRSEVPSSINVQTKDPVIIPLSARTKEQLELRARDLFQFLSSSLQLPVKLPNKDSKEQLGFKTQLEKKIVEILSNLLNVERDTLATGQSFSDYGAELIHMTKLFETICQEYGFELDLDEWIKHDSMESLLLYCLGAGKESPNQSIATIPVVDLQSLAYTLQAGREAMDERLVFVVTSIKELVEKLGAYLAGEQEIEDFYQGEVKGNKETLGVFATNEELQEAIEKWIQRRKLSNILDLWVKGLVLDWNKFYGETKPKRISLPTYSFAKERYWIPETQSNAVPLRSGTGVSMIHPLLQENTSDLTEQRFTSTFTGKEFFLNDHKIKGEKVLPGVCYLEMARAAVEKVSGEIKAGTAIYLKNVVWAQPIVVDVSGQKVHIGLIGEDDGQIQYEVYTESDSEEEVVAHSQGIAEVRTKEEAPPLDIHNLQSLMNQGTLNAQSCYQAFEEMGIGYGDGHRGIQEIHKGENQLLARLSIPSSVQNTQSEYVLHPGLMDSGLQSSIGLMLKHKVLSDGSQSVSSGSELLLGIGRWSLRPSLPFAMDSMEILGSCTSKMYAWVRYSGHSTPSDKVQKLDLDMCDEQGNVCVKMRGFFSRTLEGELGTLKQKPVAHTTHKEIRTGLESFASDRDPSTSSDHQESLREKSVSYFQKLVAETLKTSPQQVESHKPLEEYGLDSILVVQLTKQLRKVFPEVTSTLFFEAQSIDGLVDYFLENRREELLRMLPLETVESFQDHVSPFSGSSTTKSWKSVRKVKRSRPHSFDAIHSGSGHIHSLFDVAIIGMSGRYPKSKNLEEFWKNLSQGVNCVEEVPKDRWNWEEYYDTKKGKPGKIYTKWGGFLEDIDKFDPLFFHISPREAERMDPQERLFLEASYQSIEDAAYTPDSLGKTRKIGVFVGVMNSRYSPQPLYFSIANRISYLLNFQGPSMAVDTACSSSLTAIHLALESLYSGLSECAIAGGVNLIIDPVHYLGLTEMTMLSGGNECRSFGEQADGFVDAEGVGAIVLKPLKQAEQDSDHIYGVLKGSAVNAGGKTNGYTVPNPKAQAILVLEALERSKVSVEQLSYVEAHGTGTSLGDPIEIAGLTRAFREKSDGKQFCSIGSVKSNIGHCESAAGIAGVTKILLQLQHEQLVPSLHSHVLNPEIDFTQTPFQVQQRLEEWKRPQRNVNGTIEETSRIAGISSFGAGGANAHVIIEEYRPYSLRISENRAPGLNLSPVIIPISARTREQLDEIVVQLIHWIQNSSDQTDLQEIAYTLQTGRVAMEERLGLLASSVKDLERKLKQQQAGEEGIPNIYRGEVKRNKEALSLIIADDDMKQTVELWVTKKKYAKLLDLWVKGVPLDWNKLYGETKPKRISLPTYPFARERYWIPETQGKLFTATTKGSVSIIHPLLHENTSDLSEQRFTSTFTGNEFFLNDHQVRGEKVLPGVCYLEMARVAVEKASGESDEGMAVYLKNVVWTHPIVVDGSVKKVHIGLSGDDSNQIQYEVYTESDNGKKLIVHSQGVAEVREKEEVSHLDMQELQSQMNQGTLDADSCYQAFKEMGIDYGGGHQGIHEIHQGENQVLARLSLSTSVQDTQSDYVLHPCLMDSALQSSIGLMLKNGKLLESCETLLKPLLPFALESLRIVSSCTSKMYAWVRYSGEGALSAKVQRIDIDLCDEQGNVCVKMRGFSLRTLEGGLRILKQRPLVDTPRDGTWIGLHSFAPVWETIAPELKGRINVSSEIKILLLGANHLQLTWIQKSYPNAALLELSLQSTIEEIQEKLKNCSFDHLLWITPDTSQTTDKYSLTAQQEQGVLKVFRIVKALLGLGYAAREIEWTIITNKTQLVKKREPISPAHAGVFGLIGSLAKEVPHWKLRLLDLDSLESVSAYECLILPWDKHGNGFAYRNKEWFRQELVSVKTLNQETSLYRKEGVYVVIGGAGGVGEVWSRFMIEHYEAHIVWIGRREENDVVKGKINSLSMSGNKPLYIQADAAKLDSLQQAFRKIQATYPKIHGVVHSAIVLQDQSLAQMTESRFRVGFSAKVDVSVNMDTVFGNEELDFMLFFSSMISFIKAPGQSNYAAGCTFKDSFAQMLQQSRSYPVKIMNWGYWGSVGIVTDESYNKRMERAGIGSIEPREAMETLQTLVNSKVSQIALIKTIGAQAVEAFHVREEMSCYPKVSDSVLPQLKESLPRQDSLKQLSALDGGLQTEAMDSLLGEFLSATLTSLGLFTKGISEFRDLSLTKQPAPFYERWLRTSISYLQKEKLLSREYTVTRKVRDLSLLWEEWEKEKTEWMKNPDQQAQVVLLEACLTSLPYILSGSKLATDVMFPDPSMRLVEGIYRGNRHSDYFNEVLGNTLVEAIRQKLKSDRGSKIRILEIGAGTGGTTAKLLAMLEEFSEFIEEYCYTDLSKAFLMHAEKNYQPGFPALTTSIFDASKSLAGQSVAKDRYDFVIAANVLHATPNIRETIRNTKSTLKNQGILLLNEISSWSLFTHLTFGLLEGWWLYEDAALRLEGCPGLSPETWQEVLEEEGFESIFFPAQNAHKFGQQIIAVGSDGIVRQRVVKDIQLQDNVVSKRNKESITSIRTIVPQVVSPTKIENKAWNGSSYSGNVTDQMRKDYTSQIITEKLSEALKVELSAIDYDESFADYGLDSITGVNLVQVVNATLQIELETTSLFEHNSVNELTKYILSTWEETITKKFCSSKGIVQRSSCLPNNEPAPSKLSSKRRFLKNIDNSKDRNRSYTTDDSIAIIGMSGRFAQSESLEEFWENLKEGKDLVKEVSRWRCSDCVASASLGQEYCSQGSFIDSIALFAPLFFKISSEEATYMDPQQRLFLEESWKALEDAGYAGKSMEGKECGVYVGCGGSDYPKLFLEEPPAQAFWGNAGSVIPARIAYYLNLQGPAVAIDTACSSSLVSIHIACQGLWSQETEMALAGGVFLQATPGFYQISNRAGMLSPKGRCHTFDARADGFVPGEGVGVVVLKRLQDALQDGDVIHGVIVGSGINQDGNTNGITAPSAKSQERLERSVYDKFKIHPESIQVVEAHGTGTKLGDTIEYDAITRSFRQETEKRQFCAIGSVKTNIGHTATASGVAGVLKLLLSLRHRQIPPSLHFREGNQAIDFESSPFYVNTQLKEWEIEKNQSRRAAVSSFGFNGTNAHLVIEEAPLIPEKTIKSPGYLVVLSARTSEQLRAQIRNLLSFCKRTPKLSMNDLSYTLFVGRMHLKHRFSCIARNQEEMISFLETWCETETVSQIYCSEIQEGKVREQTFLKNCGNQCIQECRNGANGVQYLEHLATIADLYIQGYSLEFHELFSRNSKKTSLPTYPFARERYWISDNQGKGVITTAGAIVSVIHPLLHDNTSG